MSINEYGLDPELLGRQLFKDLVVEDWETILKRATLQNFHPGQVVVKQGKKSPGLCIVKSGWLRVERDEGGQLLPLARRGPGELLGEMSVLEQTRAMATVTADDEVELYILPARDLNDLLVEAPGFATRFYRSLALHFSGRLREAAARYEQVAGQQQAAQSQVDEAVAGAYYGVYRYGYWF